MNIWFVFVSMSRTFVQFSDFSEEFIGLARTTTWTHSDPFSGIFR